MDAFFKLLSITKDDIFNSLFENSRVILIEGLKHFGYYYIFVMYFDLILNLSILITLFLFVFVLTNTQTTSEARAPLYLICVIHFLCELFIFGNVYFIKLELLLRIRGAIFVRIFFIVYSIVVYIKTHLSYKRQNISHNIIITNNYSNCHFDYEYQLGLHSDNVLIEYDADDE
jgi:hypothetical protein